MPFLRGKQLIALGLSMAEGWDGVGCLVSSFLPRKRRTQPQASPGNLRFEATIMQIHLLLTQVQAIDCCPWTLPLHPGDCLPVSGYLTFVPPWSSEALSS